MTATEVANALKGHKNWTPDWGARPVQPNDFTMHGVLLVGEFKTNEGCGHQVAG